MAQPEDKGNDAVLWGNRIQQESGNSFPVISAWKAWLFICYSWVGHRVNHEWIRSHRPLDWDKRKLHHSNLCQAAQQINSQAFPDRRDHNLCLIPNLKALQAFKNWHVQWVRKRLKLFLIGQVLKCVHKEQRKKIFTAKDNRRHKPCHSWSGCIPFLVSRKINS